MIARAVANVQGSLGGGKTALLESLLAGGIAPNPPCSVRMLHDQSKSSRTARQRGRLRLSAPASSTGSA